MKNTRRKFIKNTSAAAFGFSILPSTQIFGTNQSRFISPNEKIRFGVIGCNGMGWSNMRSHLTMPEVDCVAICDVDDNVLSRRKNDYSEIRTNKIDTYKDYRDLLKRKDIDAVIIGTPDHWHCKIMVDALESGKHVYVEKPIANTIEECNIMLAAAKKHGKVIQVGQWQRSGDHYRKAIDIVQSGKLGNIRLVKAWAYQGWCEEIPVKPDSTPPAGVDYKMWLGPAPMRQFNPNRFHFNFRWFWDYAGGLMTDWGVHELDIALYAMGAERPKSVMASGGKFAFPNDAQETPDSLQAVFEFEKFNLLWEHATGIDLGPYGRREGMAFIGNNGTLVLNRDGYEVMVERVPNGYGRWKEDRMEQIEKYDRPEGVNYLQVHCQNFVDAMKANDISILNTPIVSGSVAAINAQMGNIAFKTGRKVYWDAEKGMFKGDEEANDLIKANYHNGWEVPRM